MSEENKPKEQPKQQPKSEPKHEGFSRETGRTNLGNIGESNAQQESLRKAYELTPKPIPTKKGK